jgi:ubiquinone/menaquinone biosynthesis C-methylase UbiE
MKILERRPQSYDRLITEASRGKIRSAKKTIAAELSSAKHILEIGCGTGELACMLARQGAMVHGFDLNPKMIIFARQRSEEQNLENKISFLNMGVHAMDGLPADEYDGVVATLVFSELSDDERQFALRHAKRILKPDGIIAIADEAIPRNPLQKMSHLLFRIPMLLATYLITRTTTRPLRNPKGELTAAGFVVEKEIRSHGDSFTIVTGRLKSEDTV